MKSILFWCLTTSALFAASPIKLPDGTAPDWSQPAVELTSTRASLDLSGPWQFIPGTFTDKTAPKGEWGWIRVPGNWMADRNSPILARGAKGDWESLASREKSAAWYRRTVDIPASWAGRSIVLAFDKISTDAIVWVGDVKAGTVGWPGGELDLSNLLTPGRHTLTLRVLAAADPGTVLIAMGNNEGQNETRKSELGQAGLIKSVHLLSRPAKTRVDDVFVRTSTRKNEVSLDITLAGLPPNASQPLKIEAQMLAPDGSVERTFTGTLPPAAQGTVTWAWPDARRWDLGKGELYTLRLRIEGEGWSDDYKQSFGFREFWTEGRNFLLNGTPIRLRPSLAGPADWDKWQKLGTNFFEVWPGSTEDRGRDMEPWTAHFPEADRRGVLLSGVAPDMGWMGTKVERPAQLEEYRKAAERIIRRDRNHPSIIMWGTSGNMLGTDYDPQVLGQRTKHKEQVIAHNNTMRTHYERADKGLTILRALDSSRPIFIHNGGSTGDVYAPNVYLNFIPLQERIEWLSEYATKGDMPAMMVEFGTPLYSSYMRGRNNYGNTSVTEPMMSEYSAIYLGDQAFVSEPVNYRQAIARQFKSDQTYEGWHWDKTGKFAPAFQDLQALFLRDTWRAWRTWGITGGMVPWDDGYVFDDGKLTAAGETFKTANADLLAWICGPAEAFTDRTHLYRAGATVEKQIALLNDRRETLPYEVTWTLKIGDLTIDQGKASGEAIPASTQFIPVRVVLPKDKTDASAVLSARVSIGGTVLEDSFAISVFAPASKEPSATPILLLDPVGKTTALLHSLGWETTPWDGKPAPGKLVVVGREALGLDGALPPDLEAHVRAGGRALVSVQQPDALRRLGFRVSYLQSRRAFPVNLAEMHPVLDGLKAEHLRDWTGTTTLLDPYPWLPRHKGKQSPEHGWRWGNRHVVSSGAIEVPHRTGWRPILVGEFALAYSPLMELDLGAGRLIWSQLDLEEQAPLDPAAERLARNLLNYAATAPLNPALPTSVVGGGADLLASVGIQAKATTSLPSGGLVIVGPKWTNDDALRDFLTRGGKALILPRTTGLLGVQIAPRAISTAPAPAAWPETRGLGIADLRTRSERNVPVVTEGAEIAAGGLLARVKIGEGVAIFCQADPAALTADKTTYERRTRWRWTRTLAQIAANLGASLEQDASVFAQSVPTEKLTFVKLGGADWKVLPTSLVPAREEGISDPGISAKAKAAVALNADTASWTSVTMPTTLDTLGGIWSANDGEMVFRGSFTVPAEWAGKDLLLKLGSIDDFDVTFVNGTEVGQTTESTPKYWTTPRDYRVPAALLKAGSNILSIRVFDRVGGGGFNAQPEDFRIELAKPEPVIILPGLYHPDWRSDFDLGDEPYRFYNW